jgi:hypothetical protein
VLDSNASATNPPEQGSAEVKRKRLESVKRELNRVDKGNPNLFQPKIMVEEFLSDNSIPEETIKKMTGKEAWDEARKIVQILSNEEKVAA